MRCLLADNEPHGLESFEAPRAGPRAAGSQVERGTGKAPKADEDPRPGVSVEPQAGQPVVSWGPPPLTAALEATAWPRVSRERTERPANRCKRLVAPGALDPNDGRQKIGGPDRHQPRHRETLAASVATAQQRLGKKGEALQEPQATGEASPATGPGKRLEQRQPAVVQGQQALQEAQHHHAKLLAQMDAFGPPKERADRDFRPQTILTCRPLLLEHALLAFLAALLGSLPRQGSFPCRFHLLFERRGASLETATESVYWVNTAGGALPYRRLLKEVVDGLGAMDLRQQGKPMRVCLKDMPP